MSISISFSLWLLAFFLSFTFLPAYQSEMMGVSLLTVLLAGLMSLYGGLQRGYWSLPKDKTLLVGGLFWLLVLGSVLWSQIQWISFVQFWVFSCLPLSVLFFVRRETEFITRALVMFMTTLALLALAQFYYMPEMLYEGRVKWPLQNPNSLGAVFSLGAFLALGQAFKTRSKSDFFFFMLIVLGVVSTGSRGALGAFIIMACCALFLLRKDIVWKKVGMVVLALAGLTLVITATGVRPDNMAVVSTVQTVTGEHSLLWSRGDIWRSTWLMIQDHPWLGTGVGTFSQFYEAHRAPQEFSAGMMAHNDPLQFWAEMGVGAFVLFYLFGFLMCRRTWKALSVAQEYPARLNIIMPVCALGAMVAHSHVSFNLHTIPILFLSGLLLAMWSVATSIVLKTGNYDIRLPKILSRHYAEFLLVASGLILALAIVPPFVSNYHIKKASQYSFEQETSVFVHHVNQADKWSFGRSAQPYILAAPIQMAMLEQDIDILMSADKKKSIAQIETLLKRAHALNPRAVGVHYNRALLAQLLTRDDLVYGEIDRHLEHALHYKPKHLPSRLWLVERYEEREEFVKALEIMEAGLSWCKRQTHEAYMCYNKMATLLLANGDIEGSTQMLHKVRDIQKKRKDL